MTTQGPQLKFIPSRGAVSFSNPTSGGKFNLDKGRYIITLSQVDPAYPTSITLADSLGNTLTFSGHGYFAYDVVFASNPITLAVLNGGAGIDFVGITQHQNEDAHTGGL